MKEKLAEAHSKTNYAKASLQSNEDAEYIQAVSYHSFIAGWEAKEASIENGEDWKAMWKIAVDKNKSYQDRYEEERMQRIEFQKAYNNTNKEASIGVDEVEKVIDDITAAVPKLKLMPTSQQEDYFIMRNEVGKIVRQSLNNKKNNNAEYK